MEHNGLPSLPVSMPGCRGMIYQDMYVTASIRGESQAQKTHKIILYLRLQQYCRL